MKCEICHKNDAQEAIERKGEELYVCKECAAAERVRRQNKSQRTRKFQRGGVEMSVTEVSGEGDSDTPPPFIKAIMDAFEGAVSDLEKATEAAKDEKPEEMHDLPTERAPAPYRIGNFLHLEGLHLIGELEAVKRALHALKMELVGVTADGLNDAGHVYRIKYTGTSERARRVAEDILAQERNARVRLFEEMPRVFGDSLCRALAILKNARLLSPGEYFDLLSPLRLAALENMLDGITLKALENMLAKTDLSSSEDNLEVGERDRVDAARADKANARFENVVLNERAEEKFL